MSSYPSWNLSEDLKSGNCTHLGGTNWQLPNQVDNYSFNLVDSKNVNQFLWFKKLQSLVTSVSIVYFTVYSNKLEPTDFATYLAKKVTFGNNGNVTVDVQYVNSTTSSTGSNPVLSFNYYSYNKTSPSV